MEKITITVETTNAAFQEGDLAYQLGAIFARLVFDISEGRRPLSVRDDLGNRVGTVSYVELEDPKGEEE